MIMFLYRLLFTGFGCYHDWDKWEFYRERSFLGCSTLIQSQRCKKCGLYRYERIDI